MNGRYNSKRLKGKWKTLYNQLKKSDHLSENQYGHELHDKYNEALYGELIKLQSENLTPDQEIIRLIGSRSMKVAIASRDSANSATDTISESESYYQMDKAIAAASITTVRNYKEKRVQLIAVIDDLGLNSSVSKKLQSILKTTIDSNLKAQTIVIADVVIGKTEPIMWLRRLEKAGINQARLSLLKHAESNGHKTGFRYSWLRKAKDAITIHLG